MAVTINASTSAGLVQTADTSGVLALQTAGTTAISIDASQRTAFVAGTAALPAITTTGDTNTGIFFPAADTIAFSEGGVEAMRLDSSGSLGIGTTNSNPRLIVKQTQTNTHGIWVESSANETMLRMYCDGTTSGFSASYGSTGSFLPITFLTSGSERMRIDTSGNLLVGTTSAVSGGGVLQVSNGITFPATQSASSDANTLDDYEEGTWTPTASNFTTTGTVTITGKYTKIGRVVYFDISFGSTGTIAFGTSALITLPFNGVNYSGMVAMSLRDNSESFTSGKSGVQCTLDVSDGRFFVGNFTTTSSGQTFVFGGFYRVS
jgi:hypothetical protein